jgi:hypothetical protein
MKQRVQDVAGRTRVCDARSDVAGRTIMRSAIALESYCHVLLDPLPAADEDAMLIEDFRDFLAADEGLEARSRLAPDPIFKERLRRRVWRNFVISRLGNGSTKSH